MQECVLSELVLWWERPAGQTVPSTSSPHLLGGCCGALVPGVGAGQVAGPGVSPGEPGGLVLGLALG